MYKYKCIGGILSVELNDILTKLDRLFEDNKIDKVEPFLREELKAALEKENYDVAVSLLNEMMGFLGKVI